MIGITDKAARHRNVNFPRHQHASLYDVVRVEPMVRQKLIELGIELHFETRAIDVKWTLKRLKV